MQEHPLLDDFWVSKAADFARIRTPAFVVASWSDQGLHTRGTLEGFKQIGGKLAPEIALLPIGAYHPESFRRVHMGPDEAVKAFKDLRARWLVPMHYGTFKLSFEDMDEPPRWLRQICETEGLTRQMCILQEGIPMLF